MVSGHAHSILSWRLKTSKQALRNTDFDVPKWDLYAVEFYGDAGCEPKSKIPQWAMGTAIAPIIDTTDDGHDPSKAFDENDSTFYRGLINDPSDSFWIGLQFHASVTTSSENIGCIRLLQRRTNFAIEAYIQEYDGVQWINRQNFMLRAGWSHISVSGEITESELSLKGSLGINDSQITRGVKESFFKESDSVGQSKPHQSERILLSTNVALTGTATQSSDYSETTTATLAIDGDINGVFDEGSVTLTQTESNPWWKVVLDDVYTIQNIFVYNQDDPCCTGDILDFLLIIYNGDTEVYNSGSDKSVDTSKRRATYAFQFSSALDGDTVLISLPRKRKQLSLTEVVINHAPAMVSDEISRSTSNFSIFSDYAVLPNAFIPLLDPEIKAKLDVFSTNDQLKDFNNAVVDSNSGANRRFRRLDIVPRHDQPRAYKAARLTQSIGSGYFRQIGDDIFDDTNLEHGTSVSMSNNGKVVAASGVVLVVSGEGNEKYLYSVSVYREVDGSWNQVGQTLLEDSANGTEYLSDGRADISLNGDGSKIAIANVKAYRIGVVPIGIVKIYSHSFSNIQESWSVGPDVDLGDAGGGGPRVGLKVSLDSSGSRLAVGVRYYDDTDFGKVDSGKVIIYTLGTDSVNIIAEIEGNIDEDYSGSSVMISGDGLCVVFGSMGVDASSGADSGSASVYCNDNLSSDWNLRDILYGEAAGDQFGFAVATNMDASFIAVSSINNAPNRQMVDAGHVRVFKSDPNQSPVTYSQIGADIDGVRGENSTGGVYYTGDRSGYSIALSDVSDELGGILRVAIGSPNNDGQGGYYNGHIRLFQCNPNDTQPTWVQVHDDINGETVNESSGSSISMSKDGRRIIVGSPNYLPYNSSFKGVAKVYEQTEYSAYPSVLSSDQVCAQLQLKFTIDISFCLYYLLTLVAITFVQ